MHVDIVHGSTHVNEPHTWGGGGVVAGTADKKKMVGSKTQANIVQLLGTLVYEQAN